MDFLSSLLSCKTVESAGYTQPRHRTQRDGTRRGDAPERNEHSVGLCQPESLHWDTLTRRRHSLTARLSKASCENSVAERNKSMRNHVWAEFAPLPKTNTHAYGGASAEYTPGL